MRLASALAVPLLLLVAAAAPAATETYLFRDSLAPEEGAGNILVPVSNATGTIVTSGPDFLDGAFVTETISPSACASTPTVRAWSFPEMAGLRYDNASPALVSGTYSISMLLRFDPMDTGYARLIDFSNSTDDDGIYKYGDGVSFYPDNDFLAAGSFVQGQDVFVTITRRGDTQAMALYVNGAPTATYADSSDYYTPLATVMYFLMDNTTGNAAIHETDPGALAYLQIRDTVMSDQDVADSLASICQAVSGGTTTTTTLPPTGCAGAPAVSFESILCRVAALRDRVQGESRLGKFQAKLVKNLDVAHARTAEAQGLGTGKKAKKKLQQAAKALTQYAHRLSSLSARKKLDSGVRTDFLHAGQAITPDVKALRSQL
jgi:hypothetical protein